MARVIAWKRSQVDQAQDSPVFRSRMDAGVNDSRENKLALIVGFGLVLFMGILVSDHLSTARREASASLQMNSGLTQQAVVPGQEWLVYGVAEESTREKDPAATVQTQETPLAASTLEHSIPIADPTEHSPPRGRCRRHTPVDMQATLRNTPSGSGVGSLQPDSGSQSTGCTNTPASYQCPCAHRLADDRRHLGRDVPHLQTC